MWTHRTRLDRITIMLNITIPPSNTNFPNICHTYHMIFNCFNFRGFGIYDIGFVRNTDFLNTNPFHKRIMTSNTDVFKSQRHIFCKMLRKCNRMSRSWHWEGGQGVSMSRPPQKKIGMGPRKPIPQGGPRMPKITFSA